MTKYDELVCLFQKWMSGPVGGGTEFDEYAMVLADVVCGFKAYNSIPTDRRTAVKTFLAQHTALIQDICPKFDFARTVNPLG